MNTPHLLGSNQLLEQIYSSRQTVVYRAINTATKKPVIIKYINSNLPTEMQLAAIKRNMTFCLHYSLKELLRL